MDKKVGLERAKELLRLHASGQLRNLVFSNEEPFQIEQFVNKQNDRFYLPKRSAENLHLRLATRTQAPAMVMVWAAVTADGRSPLVFINSGVKINAEYSRDNALKTLLKPRADKHFDQEWLKKEVPRFISTHNGHQNLRISIRWTLRLGHFGE